MNDTDNSIKLMLGYLCIANEPEASLVRKVQILDRFSLLDKEISIICDCSEQSVRNARQVMKKKNASKTK